MLIITGSGNLTRTPELRTTNSGKAVTTVSVACQTRSRADEPTYVDLIVWETQAEAAVKYLTKGRAVSFSGRPEARAFMRSGGDPGTTIEVHNVELEYGAKTREREPDAESSDAHPVDDETASAQPEEAVAA